MSAWRIYYVISQRVGRLPDPQGEEDLPERQPWTLLCERLRAADFNTLLIAPPWQRSELADSYALSNDSDDLAGSLTRLAALCKQHDLALLMDVVLDQVITDRSLPVWIKRMTTWADAGLAGFRFDAPPSWHSEGWQALLAGVREVHPDCRFFAWTPGMTPAQLAVLRPAGFDGVFSSVPWWDYRAAWFAEEDSRLRAVAPVIAMPQAPSGHPTNSGEENTASYQQRALRALWTAAVTGDGIMVPADFGGPDLWPALAEVNQWLKTVIPVRGRLHLVGGTDNFCTVIARGNGLIKSIVDNAPKQARARLLLINPHNHAAAKVVWTEVRRALPDGYASITSNADGDAAMASALGPAGYALYTLTRTPPVRDGLDGLNRQVRAAIRAARIAIENITPLIDGGLHAVKCTLGETVRVEADLFMDGHDQLRAALLWRPADQATWNTVPMAPLGNDRWAAVLAPERLGPHQYTVCGWLDVWRTFRDELKKKQTAGQDVRLEVWEGVAMLQEACQRGRAHRAAIKVLMNTLRLFANYEVKDKPPPRRGPNAASIEIPAATPAQIDALLAVDVATAMQELDDRLFEHIGPTCSLMVERVAARYASWYEIFPRSQSGQPDRHGTFDDVIARLPLIRDMGFDVLYFPPIHPIGVRHRKGRNNSLRAGPNDPGSPYAIGATEGGHDAIHPQLGTLQDFQRLIEAAHCHGLEIALDFAIQCSPDHPWLTQHPDWFGWRADGSLRYAENPPKKYQDIVNVDFYSGTARVSRKVALWRAWRDIVLFWIRQGIRTFRVDNPHTKPLPFWEWMIGDVRCRHPDVIFLSEAFTRPRMMYRLAKIGFSQSYTYFTWRHRKTELIEYLTELAQPPVADFFRPHFFVNTPDINPKFLQQSGRPGFLIRAALAATTSGLWGVYNGFEGCEAQAVPGTEEYLDSEKYQIRRWVWDQPGNIVAEITRLNQIRRANPALQTQRGFSVLNAANDQVLCFWKATPDRSNVVMVAISLDPYAPQSTAMEIPLWAFQLPDDATLQAECLVDGQRHALHGKRQQVTLTPDQPYRIWRLWEHA